MKTILTFLLSFFLSNQGYSYCLFGSHLIQTARLSDLMVEKEIIVQNELLLPEKIRVALYEHLESKSFLEAVKKTDDNEFILRVITSKTTKTIYYMILYYAGDNISGLFLNSITGKISAIISDGSIIQCNEYYDSFDNLPWFYTN